MITIPAKELKRLIDLAETSYPNEACALLIGERLVGEHARVIRVEPSANIADTPRTRFEIDPGLRIGIERELRSKTECIIGVWHSHPDGLARPSQFDHMSVQEPELVWLVTAVLAGQSVQTGAFLPDLPRGFRTIPIETY